MHLFPVFLVIFLVFINRYIFGLHLRKLKGESFDRKLEGYEPGVTIITPMFNEGEHIYHTILSLLEQDYPADKLTIMVVDDCSTDDSYAWACKAREGRPNVVVLKNPHNMGKRMSINRAVRRAQSEIIVSVDSDVVVDKQAVRELVKRFVRPNIAAVGGRVYVSNAKKNWLTRMQAVKYYFGYEYLKSLERAFSSVMCLSGCLTAYRRHVLLELEPILETRNLLGIPIKYGEDRFLTRQILKAGYETVMTLEAFCFTKAPDTLSKYFAQQLRWRRSNLVDFIGGISHVWKLHPAVAIHYFSLMSLLLAYPMVIVENVRNESFFILMAFHAVVLVFLGMVYRFGTRDMPEEYRVGALDFVAMAVVMPVTYVVITPLALFTLDSSSWETRGHSAAIAQGDALAPAGAGIEPVAAVPSLDGAPVHAETAMLASKLER